MEQFETSGVSKQSLPIDWAQAHPYLRRPRQKRTIKDRFAPKLIPKKEVDRLMSELTELEEKRITAVKNQQTPVWARGASSLGLRDPGFRPKDLDHGATILSRRAGAICD
jgi:hypothetical protein